MIHTRGSIPPLKVMEVTESEDVAEVGRLAHQRVRYERNAAWFERNASEVRDQHAGQFVCVAGEELFAGPDAREVYARAKAAHPGDWGAFFTRYVNPLTGVKI